MSHTWKIENVVFIGNSDISGDITIVHTPFPTIDPDMVYTITIPGHVLMMFAKNRMADEEIDRLEKQINE